MFYSPAALSRLLGKEAASAEWPDPTEAMVIMRSLSIMTTPNDTTKQVGALQDDRLRLFLRIDAILDQTDSDAEVDAAVVSLATPRSHEIDV